MAWRLHCMRSILSRDDVVSALAQPVVFVYTHRFTISLDFGPARRTWPRKMDICLIVSLWIPGERGCA